MTTETYDSKSKTVRYIILLIFFWSMIVLPLCYFGYGSDEDAWIVGEEASIIWENGQYSISRAPGFPLYEISITLCSHIGSWYLSNFFSCLWAFFLAYFIFLLIKIGHFKNPLWVFAGVIFLPQIIINSSSTIDYVPSLGLFVGAYYFFVTKKYYLVAVLIGISCGFRPSNGLIILPFIIVQFIESGKYAKSIKMFAIAFISGIITYLPVLIQYGIIDIGRREVDVPFLQNVLIGGYQALTLFGIGQTILMGIFFVFYITKIKKSFKKSFYIRFHVLNILLWILLFTFITSSEGEYLFPILFSVIFLADAVFEKKHFKILVLILLSYNLVSLEMLGGESGNRKISPRPELGFIIRDLQDRRYKLWYREATTNFKTDKKTLLMYGFVYVKPDNDKWEYSSIANGIIKQKNGNLYLSERILDESLLKKLKDDGFEIYVWNNRKWEYITLKLDFWTLYVKVVYDLEEFLGSKKYGQLMQ